MLLALAGLGARLSAHAADDAPATLADVLVRANAPAPRTETILIDPTTSRPKSTLTAQAIDTLAPTFSDFGTLANMLPSFVSSAPNGNGFDAAKNMTLRGFPDGQFNVTLDGIPFADPDGFSHHSTSIFPASSLESLAIDRSPGSGSSLGYSGTGGTIALRSLAIAAEAGATVYGAWGSFRTYQEGVKLNTAAPAGDGQTGLLMNLQHLQSDGAMANAFGRRDDILLKAESRVAGARLTLFYSFDDYHFFNPPSVTSDQVASQGSGVGFGLNPGSPDFNEYAKTDRSTDFGYARLETGLVAGFGLSNTVYTYSYDNRGLSPNGDITAPKSWQVGGGFGVPATDVGGRLSTTRYRTVGDIFRLDRDIDDAKLRLHAGVWLEHARLKGRRDAIDLQTGIAYAANKTAGSSVLYDYRSTLATVAPFVDAEWQATPALTVRPGLRWQRVSRGFDAAVVPTSRPGTGGQIERRVPNLLPSLEANLALAPQTHVYAQWARGALVPNQSFFYTAKPALGNQAEPQTARALQAGVVQVVGPVRFTVDGYQIDLANYVSQTTDANKNTVFVNNGDVRYRGLEAEAVATLGGGFDVTANGSLLRATFGNDGMASPTQKAGDSIALVPAYTGFVGLFYRGGPWSGGVMAKFVGVEYQGAGGSGDGPDRRVAAYHYTNLSLTRTVDRVFGVSAASVTLQVDNLENRTAVTDSAGRAAIGAGGPLLVNVLARRSWTLAVHCSL